MAEKSDQIVEELQVQRERLSKNVNDLESYVREKPICEPTTSVRPGNSSEVPQPVVCSSPS